MEISHSSWPWHRSDAAALAGYANMMMMMMMYLLLQVGFNKDGKLQAVDITMYANDGYLSEYGWAVRSIVIFHDVCYIAAGFN